MACLRPSKRPMRLLLERARLLEKAAPIAFDQRTDIGIVGTVMHDDEIVITALGTIELALQHVALTIQTDNKR